MRSQHNRFDTVSRAILATAFIIALGGFTEGSCFGPDQDGEPCGETTCAAGETCVDLAVECIQAPCPSQPTCVPAPQPTECSSDLDCGDGAYCDFDGAYPEGFDPDPTNCIALIGVCRPIETCNSNSECGIDEHCEFGPTTRCDAICEEGGDCRCGGAPAEGTCEPGPAECFSDADCPADSFCPAVLTDCGCAAGEDCPMDCYWGPSYCEPRGPTSECDTDADCGPGALCSFMEIVCAGGPNGESPDCFEQLGICIPGPIDECVTDADCARGETCVFNQYDCLCAGGPEDYCDCGTSPGTCEPQPGEACQSDADCPGGFCEAYATCDAIGCPPAPASACVYPSCDDGGPVLCDMIPPTCAPGQVAAARNGCWECVDARTCTGGNACWGAWTDETGTCRSANDGTLPSECCTGACNSDYECGPGASCWDGLCVPPPQTCSGESDPRVTYVCHGSECWVIGAWLCASNQEMFSNECGSGCVDTGLCTDLGQWACEADSLCSPVFGPSSCDPATGVCTADEGYQGCTRNL